MLVGGVFAFKMLHYIAWVKIGFACLVRSQASLQTLLDLHFARTFFPSSFRNTRGNHYPTLAWFSCCRARRIRNQREDVLGLENTFWSSWHWPRNLKSSKIALSSARGQHYFLNRWNFVGKRPETSRKICEHLFCFPQLEHKRSQRRGDQGTRPPPNWNFTNNKNVPKKLTASSVSVSF